MLDTEYKKNSHLADLLSNHTKNITRQIMTVSYTTAIDIFYIHDVISEYPEDKFYHSY